MPARGDKFEMRAAEGGAGIAAPGDIFALIESVLAAEAGRSVDQQLVWLGRVMSRFTEVAATQPGVAWFPVARTPAELSEVTPGNRLVVEPYTKRMNSFPTVDLATAMFVTSERLAHQLGIPDNHLVYPHAVSTAKDPHAPSGREHFARSPALDHALRVAFEQAAVGPNDCVAFDLYSCFPAAVQMIAGAIGSDLFDERKLTVTGGLPYFGGPGANYAAHALVRFVHAARASAGPRLSVGLGGAAGDFGVCILDAAAPAAPFSFDEGTEVTAELRARDVRVAPEREGEVTVTAMTVAHDRNDGPVRAPMIVRFDDGTLAGARSPSVAATRALAGTSLVGQRVRVRQADGHSIVDL